MDRLMCLLHFMMKAHFDPLPLYDVSGFPVSIEFNDYYFKKVELLSFKLFDNTDNEVKELLLMDKNNDPHERFTDKQFTLFPLKRLSYNAQYRAEVSYRVKNKVSKPFHGHLVHT